MNKIYIDRLCLYFENTKQLEQYINNNYETLTKKELQHIILNLLRRKDTSKYQILEI